MSYYISQNHRHCLNDLSNLVLRAHDAKNSEGHLYVHEFSDPYFKLNKKTEEHFVVSRWGSYFRTSYAIPLSKLLDLFENYAKKATVITSKPQKALQLIRQHTAQKYYSGICGRVRHLLNRVFGWYSFDLIPEAKRIDQISKSLLSIPRKTPLRLLSQIKASITSKADSWEKGRKVFTDNLKDINAHGALGGYTYQPYAIKWMSPRQYLDQVDPHFKRHNDEDSMPWIYNEMAALIEGKSSGPKFSPLMMRPHDRHTVCDSYSVLAHEGRHRALAAERLGIAILPVALGFKEF